MPSEIADRIIDDAAKGGEPDFLTSFKNNNPGAPKSAEPTSKIDDKPKDAPKEPDKPATQQDDDIPAIIKSPKAADEFRKIRAAEQQAKKERDDYKFKLEENAKKVSEYEARLNTRTGPDEETVKKITSLEMQNREISDRLKMLDIERHPAFVKFYGDKIASAKAIAFAAAGADKKAALEKIIALPEGEFKAEKLEEFASEMPFMARGKLTTALVKLDEIVAERQLELDNAATRLKELEIRNAQEGERTNTERQNTIKSYTAAALETAKTFDAFKPIEGDTEHNEAIKDREAFIQNFYQGKTPKDMLPMIPGLAQEALHYKTKVIPTLKAEIEKRDKIIAEMTSANPRMGERQGKDGVKGEAKTFEQIYSDNAPKRGV